MTPVAFLLLALPSAAAPAGVPFDYPVRTPPIETLGLACEPAVALDRAMRFARRTHPALAPRLEARGFTVFNSLYRGESANPPRIYELKAILDYRPRGTLPNSHFESTLTVTLDRECKPLEASYSSGDVVVTY